MASKKKIRSQYKFANSEKTRSRDRLLHLMRRFQTRLDIIVSLNDIEYIKEQIKNETAIYVDSKEGSKRYIVKCRDKDIIAVILKGNKQLVIVTVYPLEKRHLNIVLNRMKIEGILENGENYIMENKDSKEELKRTLRVIRRMRAASKKHTVDKVDKDYYTYKINMGETGRGKIVKNLSLITLSIFIVLPVIIVISYLILRVWGLY